jgi:glycosyltransferase involved in cell wall biosynthesis
VEKCKPYRIPIYVSDNASPYDFPALIEEFRSLYPEIHVRRNSTNVGMGANFLNVVAMADAKYVWLFSDDDRLADGALERVLPLCTAGEYDLIVPDREYRKDDLSYDYGKRAGNLNADRVYDDPAALLIDACVKHYTFIGCLVFRLSAWRKVDGARYLPYPYFTHLSVVAEMMLPRGRALLLSEALVHVRGGRFSWEKNAAMVWYIHLQECVSHVPGYTNSAKRRALWKVWREMSIYPLWLVVRHGRRTASLREFCAVKTLAVYGRLGALGMFTVNCLALASTFLVPARLLDVARDRYRVRQIARSTGRE